MRNFFISLKIQPNDQIGKRSIMLAGAYLMASIAGCAWVDLKPQAEKVRLLSPYEVGRCKLLGKITSNTASTIGFIARSKSTVQEELNRLARNNAATMDGDTVVPIGRMTEGEQSFNVYRCINP